MSIKTEADVVALKLRVDALEGEVRALRDERLTSDGIREMLQQGVDNALMAAKRPTLRLNKSI